MPHILRIGAYAFMLAVSAVHAQVGYLGPAGSWTHQACIDLYGEQGLVPFSRDQLFAAFADRKIDKFCIPVTTSVVGVTPYIDDVLAMQGATIVAEYPKMLGYSLLAKPGTTRDQVKTVLAHPVALEEVKPWLDKEMPSIVRKPVATGGAAAQEVANSATSDLAAMGPPSAAKIYGLVPIVNGIEEGPHNVTRWWVIGREAPAPTGNDKTTLVLSTSERTFGQAMTALAPLSTRVLTIYERPSKKTLDTHAYVVELAGNAAREPLKQFLQTHPEFKLLGSYPRKY
jgi:prephenate dehydratase